MMNFNFGVIDFVKRVIHKTINFEIKNFYSALNNFNEDLGDLLCILWFLQRIFVAALCRLLFGAWLKTLRVVPLQVFEKDDYYEDPGVVEMHALLRGEDCSDTNLEQPQQLPFPPADFDPHDKIYLALYFYRLQRIYRNSQANWIQNNNEMYRKISSYPIFQSLSRYFITRVPVNNWARHS